MVAVDEGGGEDRGDTIANNAEAQVPLREHGESSESQRGPIKELQIGLRENT